MAFRSWRRILFLITSNRKRPSAFEDPRRTNSPHNLKKPKKVMTRKELEQENRSRDAHIRILSIMPRECATIAIICMVGTALLPSAHTLIKWHMPRICVRGATSTSITRRKERKNEVILSNSVNHIEIGSVLYILLYFNDASYSN